MNVIHTKEEHVGGIVVWQWETKNGFFKFFNTICRDLWTIVHYRYKTDEMIVNDATEASFSSKW